MDPLVKKIFLNLITYQPYTPNHILVDHLATAKNDDVFETRLLVKKKKMLFSATKLSPRKKKLKFPKPHCESKGCRKTYS